MIIEIVHNKFGKERFFKNTILVEECIFRDITRDGRTTSIDIVYNIYHMSPKPWMIIHSYEDTMQIIEELYRDISTEEGEAVVLWKPAED